MALLFHAVRGVFRNGRRSLTALLGTMLVVAVIAGENIAVDSTARSLWETIEDTLEYHFSGFGPLNNTESLRADLADVRGFREIGAYAYVGVELVAPAGRENLPRGIYAVRPDFADALALRGYKGALAVGGDNVTVTSSFASEYNVTAGQEVTLTFLLREWTGNGTGTANRTVHVAAVVTRELRGLFADIPDFWVNPLDVYVAPDLAVEILRDVGAPGEMAQAMFEGAQYLGWLDTDALVDPYDIPGSQAQVRKAMATITRLARPHDVQIDSGGGGGTFPPGGGGGSALESALSAYSGFSTVLRFVFLLLSLPVVFLGLYLGVIGVDLGMAERRREIGLLKARGASDGQVFQTLLVEALLLAALAAVGGIALGAAVSQLFLTIGPFAQFAGGAPPSFAISSTTVAVSAFFAFLFMLLGAYKPFKRAAALTVNEGLSYYTPGEVAVEYKPTLDLALVAIASLTFIVDVLLGGDFTNFFFLILAVVFVFLTPLAPFFLAFGLTRLITRWRPRIYEVTARVAKPIAKDIWPLVHRNLSRNPRRASNITTIMTLALVFALMITLLYSSTVAYQERSVRADNGSDIRIDVFGASTADASGAAAVAGVSRVVRVWWAGSYYALVLFDAAEYAAAVPRDDFFFTAGSWDALAELGTAGHVLVNEAVAQEQAIGVGELLPLDAEWFGGEPGDFVTVTVAGIVKALPGLHQSSLAFDQSVRTQPFIFFDPVSLVNASRFQVAPQRFLVQVDAGADPSAVGDALEDIDPTRWSVHVTREEVADITSVQGGGGFLSLMSLNIGFAILIATAGLGLVLYTASIERRAEFASMVARGASRRQTASLLLGEAWVIIVLGLVIGVVVGVLTGWVFLLTFFRGLSGVLQPTLAFSWESLAVIAATAGAMLAAAAAISWRAGTPDVVDVLRQRGG